MPSGPKVTKFTNRHADEARERENEKKGKDRSAAAQAKEDAEWEDDGDRKLQKKNEREVEAQAKLAEAQQRREEKDRLRATEEAEMSSKTQPTKITKKQMQRDVAKLVANYDKEMEKIRPSEVPVVAELPKQNLNRAVIPDNEVKAATGVNASIALLEKQTLPTQGVVDDRHIGKRARVLYRKFCEEETPGLKDSHPSLRRNQYNDMLWEMWQKSEKNPFVVRSEMRSAQRLEEERRWMEGGGDDEDEVEGDN